MRRAPGQRGRRSSAPEGNVLAAKTSVSTPLSPGLARHSFAKIREPLAVPDLLALQKASFDWLLGREDWQAKVAAEIAAGNTEIPQVLSLIHI